jgi:centromere protein J
MSSEDELSEGEIKTPASNEVMLKRILSEIKDMNTSVTSSVLDNSSQARIQNLHRKEEYEESEKFEFEQLEEAAERMSINSDCSLVQRFLSRKSPSNTSEVSTSQQCLSPSIDEKDKEEQFNQHQKQLANQMKQQLPTNTAAINFDDVDSWSDSDNEDRDVTILPASPGPIESTPSSAAKHRNKSRVETNVESPAPSQFVAKLFPAANKNAAVVDSTDKSVSALPKPDQPPSDFSLIIQQKQAELEKEIKKFRTENQKIELLRQEREQEVKMLKGKIEEFEKHKHEELARIEQYKCEEENKLKQEKSVFYAHQKATRNMPNKEERKEIENLREQISKLESEISSKEQR